MRSDFYLLEIYLTKKSNRVLHFQCIDPYRTSHLDPILNAGRLL